MRVELIEDERRWLQRSHDVDVVRKRFGTYHHERPLGSLSALSHVVRESLILLALLGRRAYTERLEVGVFLHLRPPHVTRLRGADNENRAALGQAGHDCAERLA